MARGESCRRRKEAFNLLLRFMGGFSAMSFSLLSMKDGVGLGTRGVPQHCHPKGKSQKEPWQ